MLQYELNIIAIKIRCASEYNIKALYNNWKVKLRKLKNVLITDETGLFISIYLKERLKINIVMGRGDISN